MYVQGETTKTTTTRKRGGGERGRKLRVADQWQPTGLGVFLCVQLETAGNAGAKGHVTLLGKYQKKKLDEGVGVFGGFI